MKIKQVFSAYDCPRSEGIQALKFCPKCGAKCQLLLSGGKTRPVCPVCGFVHYKNPSPAVSVLIVDGQKLILGKRAQGSFQGGKWCLPCGFIEYDEDFLSAGQREVYEETNLSVEIKSIINVNTNYLSEDLHSIVVVLLGNVVSGNPAAGDDLESVSWYDISEPLPELAFEADKHIIERYFKTNIVGLPVEKPI